MHYDETGRIGLRSSAQSFARIAHCVLRSLCHFQAPFSSCFELWHITNRAFPHEHGSEWESKQANAVERSRAHKQSEQCGASKRVSGARECVNGQSSERSTYVSTHGCSIPSCATVQSGFLSSPLFLPRALFLASFLLALIMRRSWLLNLSLLSRFLILLSILWVNLTLSLPSGAWR